MTGAEVTQLKRWWRVRAGWYESAPAEAEGVYVIYIVDDRGLPYWNVCQYRWVECAAEPGGFFDLVSTGMLADTLRSAKWQVAIEQRRAVESTAE